MPSRESFAEPFVKLYKDAVTIAHIIRNCDDSQGYAAMLNASLMQLEKRLKSTSKDFENAELEIEGENN